MNLSLLAIIIYAAGILFGAFFLDIWGAETSILKGIIGLVWTAIFLITLFYAEKKNTKDCEHPKRLCYKRYKMLLWIFLDNFNYLFDS